MAGRAPRVFQLLPTLLRPWQSQTRWALRHCNLVCSIQTTATSNVKEADFHPGLRALLKSVGSGPNAPDSPSGLGLGSYGVQALQLVASQLERADEELEQLEALGDGGEDGDLRGLISEEAARIAGVRRALQDRLVEVVVPEDDQVDGMILEVSTGVGGKEAMLFCAELLDMYQWYCAGRGWPCALTDCETTELEGVRHASLAVDHADAYGRLRFEAGVHRVQRVPRTEKAGRIHTSTVSVVVLPRPSPITIVIDPKDLRMDTKRASGAGGQHVNTTESAVRLTHIPSGLVVECQTHRSQLQNRMAAIETLRARLYQRQIDQLASRTRSTRKLQVTSSCRSEKIRTYNFPQDRVTDHRINATSHNLAEFLKGQRPLDVLLDRLTQESRQERLQEFLDRLPTT